jgi:hypothetical protein
VLVKFHVEIYIHVLYWTIVSDNTLLLRKSEVLKLDIHLITLTIFLFVMNIATLSVMHNRYEQMLQGVLVIMVKVNW